MMMSVRLRMLWHPRAGELVEFVDGELKPERAKFVRGHVAQCKVCERRVDRICEGLAFLNRAIEISVPELSVEPGLRRLLAAIEARAPQTEPLPVRVVQQRIVSELGIYLGQNTAAGLLRRCGQPVSSRNQIRQEIEPVLTAFLGRYASSAVMSNVLRIWDRQEMAD